MQRPPNRLEAALLEFQQAPVTRAGIQRRPALLFASMREVLLLAAGRAAEVGARADPGVEQAARDFVRHALLFAQADHYQLLGLAPEAEASEIKERYRLLMRLIHPDFSRGLPVAWPEDAAVRVNLAYEALSSPERRAAYDRLLATPASTAAPAPVPGRRPAARHPARRDPSRGTFLRLAAGFGLFGVGVSVLLALLGSFQERETIIQHEASSRPVSVGANVEAGTAVGSAVPPSMSSALRRLASAPASAASRAAPAPPVPGHRVAAASAATARDLVAPATALASQESAAPALPRPAAGAPPAPDADSGAQAPALPQALPPARPSPPQAPVQPVLTAAAAARPGPSLAQVQPVLLAMLHQMESADAERVLSRLDHDARSAASAQGFLRYFQAAVEGARSVTLAGVNLHAEPRDGRLVVSGSVRLQVHQAGGASLARELPLIAEFSQRDGVVALTALSLGAGAR